MSMVGGFTAKFGLFPVSFVCLIGVPDHGKDLQYFFTVTKTKNFQI